MYIKCQNVCKKHAIEHGLVQSLTNGLKDVTVHLCRGENESLF